MDNRLNTSTVIMLMICCILLTSLFTCNDKSQINAIDTKYKEIKEKLLESVKRENEAREKIVKLEKERKEILIKDSLLKDSMITNMAISHRTINNVRALSEEDSKKIIDSTFETNNEILVELAKYDSLKLKHRDLDEVYKNQQILVLNNNRIIEEKETENKELRIQLSGKDEMIDTKELEITQEKKKGRKLLIKGFVIGVGAGVVVTAILIK